MDEQPGLTGDERAELERLRAENAALRAQAPRPDGPGPGSRQRWRTIVAVVLIVLGCVLAPLGGVAVWARNQVTNTDRYVRTVAPLASDPAIQQAIADQITTQIFTYIDVQALTNQALDALTERGLRPRLPTQLRARRPFPTIGPPTRPWTRMQLPRSCRCPDRGGADQRARPRDRRHSGGRPRDRLRHRPGV